MLGRDLHTLPMGSALEDASCRSQSVTAPVPWVLASEGGSPFGNHHYDHQVEFERKEEVAKKFNAVYVFYSINLCSVLLLGINSAGIPHKPIACLSVPPSVFPSNALYVYRE